jgi:hypothetical protein
MVESSRGERATDINESATDGIELAHITRGGSHFESTSVQMREGHASERATPQKNMSSRESRGSGRYMKIHHEIHHTQLDSPNTTRPKTYPIPPTK